MTIRVLAAGDQFVLNRLIAVTFAPGRTAVATAEHTNAARIVAQEVARYVRGGPLAHQAAGPALTAAGG